MNFVTFKEKFYALKLYPVVLTLFKCVCVIVPIFGHSSWEAGLALATQPLTPVPRPQVDHAAAVKEYSRSSADQEEPLPHELRPSAVLSRTMDYLVTQVMDQKEGSLRDWYDFVWNRTRGIRKVSATCQVQSESESSCHFTQLHFICNKKYTVT